MCLSGDGNNNYCKFSTKLIRVLETQVQLEETEPTQFSYIDSLKGKLAGQRRVRVENESEIRVRDDRKLEAEIQSTKQEPCADTLGGWSEDTFGDTMM